MDNARQPFRIVVIGGGITGLSAAHRLMEARRDHPSIEVTLLEASPSPGGTIRTIERDGFIVELGPDSFLSTKPWLIRLCDRIGIKDRIMPMNDAFRRSHVVFQGRLHPLPEGFLMMAPSKFWPFVTSPLFSLPGKLRMALDLILPRGPYNEDESLGSFVTRRLGREALERVAQPLIGGIYTGDPGRLSLRATMPRFLEMEEKHGSVIRAMWKQRRDSARSASSDSGVRYSLMVSFDRGMQTIVDELLRLIPDGVIQPNQTVASLNRREQEWDVVMLDGTTRTADAVLVALPAYRAASLVKQLSPALSADLASIMYASSVIVNLAYRRKDIPHPLDGFGFVVPSIEDRDIIACSFSSVKFPGRAPDGCALLRTFLGGAMQARLYDVSDDDLIRMAQDELKDLLGISAAPMWSILTRWPLSMPQYQVGHLQHVDRIRKQVAAYPGLAFAGNAYGGVGVPDCVYAGETAAEQAVAWASGKQAVMNSEEMKK